VSSETLSQNEIDALLGGKRPPVPVAPRRAPATDAQVYDFRRPHRVSKEKLRTLEAMYERFAKALEGWLLGRVRGNIQYIFDVADSGGQQGILDFGHEFAYFLVDRLFGGSGTPTILDRALTPIERMAVRSVAERVLAQLVEVWSDYIELSLGLTGFESIPEILRAANPEDPVLVANIEVAAADTRSLLLVCLPFAVLEKFFAGGSERRVTVLGSTREQEENRERTEQSVRGARVPVVVRLPAFRITLRELVGLTPGSVVATGLARTTPLDVYVGPQRRFVASPGRVGPSLAVRLLERNAPGEPGESNPSPRR
jgi:flagellar motor switch protein FliM